VRIRGDLALTHALLALGALRASDRLAVACDLTAAYLWSMIVPSGFGLDVDAQACAIATFRDGSRHRAGGVRGRRLELPDEHITTIGDIRVTTPARTWIDCAALVRWTDLVAMGDQLLRSGLVSRDELEAMIKWGHGRRGIRNARRALPLLDPAAESPGESWTRAILARARLPRPHCNVTVVVDGRVFRLDIAWPDAKVAAEYDGEEFHGPDQAPRDEWRRGLLAQDGWRIVVVRKADLARPDDVVAAVRQAFRAQ
jgi:very-short-patch-repair endonuclease